MFKELKKKNKIKKKKNWIIDTSKKKFSQGVQLFKR